MARKTQVESGSSSGSGDSFADDNNNEMLIAVAAVTVLVETVIVFSYGSTCCTTYSHLRKSNVIWKSNIAFVAHR